MSEGVPTSPPAALLARLEGLRERCLQLEQQHAEQVEACERDGTSSDASVSARNLLHYLALRREDLRGLHIPLAEMGLSSLGRVESHVLANLDAVIFALGRVAGLEPRAAGTGPSPIGITDAHRLLE